MKYGLISPEKLPKGFRYPARFTEFCAVSAETDIKPWSILETQDDVEGWLEIVQEWYPTRSLIPFAQHDVTGDDIACFDGNDRTGNPRVHLVHSFASAGWEDRGSVANFDAWISEVVAEDRAEHLAELAEDAAYEAELAAAEAAKNEKGS